MNLFTIAWKNIKQRALPSLLTSLNVALGVMLMVAVFVCSAIVDRAFSQQAIPYDLVIGAKGSELQLVLSAVYRIEPAIGKLPYQFLEEVKSDRRVVDAVPLVFGDYTEQGAFPIVGTTDDYFKMGVRPGEQFKIQGQRIGGPFDAIIGDRVARTNGWTLGSEFKLVHGGEDSDHVHDETFKVVGILASTQTPNDKTVFIDIDGFFQIAGHEVDFKQVIDQNSAFWGSDPERRDKALAELRAIKAERDAAAPGTHFHDTPAVLKSLAAILVRTRENSTMDPISLSSEYRNGFKATAVNPIIPMSRLRNQFLGNIQKVLFAMSVLILLVSAVSIFVSIYNSMSDRRREISIMRALGAARSSVFSIILAESVLLCAIGGFVGLILGHGLVFLASDRIAAETGLLLDPWAFQWTELLIFPVLFVMAVVVGFLPALTAYRTDVASNL